MPPPPAVDIRWMALEGLEPAAILALERHLDAAERAKAARFHFERDRLAYVAAHALTRTVLAARTGLAPPALRFTEGAHGKPDLAAEQNPGGLCFNLTHTTGLVAVAVTGGVPVGLDVEAVDRRGLSLAIADRYFAPAEIADLHRTPPEALQEALVALWTLKEAYVKAVGHGLSLSLSAFSFRIDPPTIAFSDRLADDPAAWTFRRLAPTPGFAMALAAKRPDDGTTAIAIREARIGADGL